MEGSQEQPQEQPQPPAQPDPVPMAQITEIEVPIDCQNCGQNFKFPIEPHVNGFKFQCTSCGAWTEWQKS